MEPVNGGSFVGDEKGAPPPPPSPLTGSYLLVIIGEPHCQQHKDIILQKIAKGLLSWDLKECLVDLEKELNIITEQSLDGEEARYGERLIQFASENLVTEILIHPAVSTLSQCVRNLLSSFTRHRHIIHAGYTFQANGSWALQDGTFSYSDFAEAFQEIEVQRVIHAYENGISIDLHCSSEGDWSRLSKENFAKACKIRFNPTDVLTAGSPSISSFTKYLEPFLVPTVLEEILESSDVVGNIRFSRPTLYVFPGGQGDAALFGINGFNMLLDGGYSRKACFWDFVRHLDRLDAVLMSRLNNSNVSGISSVLKRKTQGAVYPQIGHFFCNIQERKSLLSPDGDKDKDPLIISLLDEGQSIVQDLHSLNLSPQPCYRDSDPIILYHKVGHGTLNMFVLSPEKNSREVREFLQKWNQTDNKLFGHVRGKEFTFPLENLISICALLVWQPSNPNDTITRILYPGSSPQKNILEGLDRLKNMEFMKHPTCLVKSYITVKKSKQDVIDKLATNKESKFINEKKMENKALIEDIKKNVEMNGDVKEKQVKKSDSLDSDKEKKPKKIDDRKKTDKSDDVSNGDKPKPRMKPVEKPKVADDGKEKKKPIDRKGPPTPKKTLENRRNGEVKDKDKRILQKSSPGATPAKSTKDENNRKVIENKKAPQKKEPSPPKPAAAETKAKYERKPISRRPKSIKGPPSPMKKMTNGIQKPDLLIKRGKLDKEGTTDSSTVSTPSAEQESVLKKDLSKLTPEEIQLLKDTEIDELNEEQEAVKEIEAVFRKGEKIAMEDTEPGVRKIKDISIGDHLDTEEYLIIEKEEVDSTDQENKEDEMKKLTRDSEESEKLRKSDGKDSDESKDMIQPSAKQQVVESVEPKKLSETTDSRKQSIISPEDKISSAEKKDEEAKEVVESQPDEKVSANVESGATTTAPTLPEDERITLDGIKEDIGQAGVEEKYVKEETKEIVEIPIIQLPPKSQQESQIKPAIIASIPLDKQKHVRDIVKTPDEVADLPVHEEVDYHDFQRDEKKLMNESGTDKPEKKEIPKKSEEVKAEELKEEEPLIKDFSKNEEKVTGKIEAVEISNVDVKSPKTEVELKKDEKIEVLEKAETETKEKADQDNNLVAEDKNIKEIDDEDWVVITTENGTDDIHDDHQVEKEIKAPGEKIIENAERKPILEDPKSHDIIENVKDEIKQLDSDSDHEVRKEDEIDEKFEEDKEDIKVLLAEADKKPISVTVAENKCEHVPEAVEALKKDLIDDTDKKIKSIKEDKHEINEIDNKLQELKKEMEQPDVDDVKIGNLENNLGKTEEATNVDMKKDFKELEKYEEILNGLKKDDKPSVKDDEIKFEVSRKNVEHAEAVILPADSSSSEEDDGPLIFKELAIDKAELGRKSPAEREEDVKKIVASVAVVLKSEVPLEEIKTKALAFTQELRETHITTQESPLLEIQVIKNEEIPVIPEETTDEEDEIRNAKIDADIEKEVEDIMRDDKDDDATVHRMLVTASSEDGGEETEICPAGSITFSKSSESSERSSPEPSQKTPSQKSSVVETLSDTTISTNKQISEIAAPKLEDKNDVTIKEETKDVVDEKVQNLKEKDVETTQMEKGADIVEDMAEKRRISIAESVGKIEGKIEDAIDFIEHKVSDYLVSRKDSLKESEKHIEEKLNQQDEGIIEKTEEFIEDTKDAFTDVLSAVADKAHSIFDGIIKSEPEEAEIKTKDSVILEDTDGVKSKDEVNKVESVITDAKIQEDTKPDELQKVQDEKIPPLVADDDDSKVEIESSEKESKTPKQRRRSSVVEAAEDFMEKSEKVFDSVFSAIEGAAKSLIHEVFDDKEQKIEDKKPILGDLVPESEKPKLDVKHETVKQDAALEDSISTLNEVTDEKVKLERRLDESKTTSELVSEKVIPLVINADKIQEKEIGIESIKKDEQHLEEKTVKASETPSPAAGVKIEKGNDEINKDQESEISKKLVSEQSIKKIIDPITIDSLGKDEKHSKEEIVKRSEALLSHLEDKVDKISAESTPEKLTKDECQPQKEKYVEISKTSVKKDETHEEDVDVNVQETSSKQIDSMDNKLIQETKEKEAKISTEPPSEKTSSLEAQTEKEKDLEISKASVKKGETHVHKVEVNVQETSSKQIDSMDNKLLQEMKEKEAKIITELPSEKTSGFEAQTEKGKDDQMSKENLQKDGETTKVPEKLPQTEQKVEKENKVESSEATLKITKEEISKIPVELEEKDTIKNPSKDSVEKNEESLEEEMEKVEKFAPTLGAKAAIDAQGQKELKDAAEETVGKQILETPEALDAPVEVDQSRKESLQKDDKSMKEEIDKIHDMFAQVEDIIEKHKDELKSKASEFLSEKPTEIKTHEGDLSINKLKKVVEGKQAETTVKDAEKTQEISPVKEKTEKSALVTESVIPVEKRTELEKVAEGSSTKEVVKEYKVAAEILKKDEKQIENEAKHLEENYKDLNTLTDSVSFDKCKVADEFKLDEKTLNHEEDQLQMEADGIRKDYEELNELSKSVSFEKCKINYDDFHLDNITLEKEEKLLEKEAVQLENVYEDVKKLSEEVSFEKCKNIEEFKVEKDVLEKEEKQIEKQVEEVEKSFDDLKKLSKEVSFEKCKSPQEFKVEKDVIEKEEKQIEEEVEVVKKSLEDLKKLSDEVVFEKCVINEVKDDKKTEEEIDKIKLEAQKEKITEKLDVNELKEEQNLVAKLPKEIEEPYKIVEECAFDKDVLKKEEIDIKKEAKKLDENLEDIMKLSAEVAFDKSKVLDDVKVSKNLLQKEEIQTKKEGSENQATFESAKKKSEEIFDKSKETDDKPLVGQSKGPLDDTAKESKDKVQLEDFTKEEKLEKSITATEKQDFKDHDAEDHKPEKTETPLSKKDLQKNEKQLGDEAGEINNKEYDNLRKLSEELQFESGDFKLDKNTLAKDEMQLQKEADHLEKSFEDVSKLSGAVVFEKCKQLPDEYETDQEIITKYDTKQIGFEETRRKSVENLPDLGASISFDKCHPPHEFDVEDPIIESGAETAKTADKKDKTTDDKTEKYHKLENGSGTKDMSLNLEAEPICKKKDLDEEEKFPTLSVEHTEAKKLSISDVEISIKTDDVDHKDIIQSFLDNERTNICDSTDAKVYVEPANSQASSIISLSTYETEKTPSDVESSGKTTPPTVPLSPVGKDLKMPVTKHDSGLSEPTETDEDDLSTKSQIANSQSDLDENDMRMDPMSASFYEPEILEKDQIIATTYLHEGSKDSKVSTELRTETTDTIKFVKGEIDPMTASFIGELPSGESSEIKHERKDSILGEPVPHTYLYEVTKARFALEQKDVMTSSFIGDQLPSSSKTPDNKESDPMTTSVYFEASSDDKKDPIASWGKPLGLPSPAPPNNNDKGTPKKEKRLPSYVSAKNKLNNNDDKRRSESPSKLKAKRMNPVYVDLTYVPHHGNHYYSFVEYFKRIRARYYVFSGLEPSRQVYDALLEAKQTWDDKELEVTIIPTYDTDILGYWVAENEELLTKLKIDLAPSASRCTINLQDHETSCSAYRLEF